MLSRPGTPANTAIVISLNIGVWVGLIALPCLHDQCEISFR